MSMIQRDFSVKQVPVQIYKRLDQIEKRVVDSWIKKGETTITDDMPKKERNNE